MKKCDFGGCFELIFKTDIFLKIKQCFVMLKTASFDSLPKDVGVNSTRMTSSNGNIFRVTVHLCWEFTGPRWICCSWGPLLVFLYFLTVWYTMRYDLWGMFETFLGGESLMNLYLDLTLKSDRPYGGHLENCVFNSFTHSAVWFMHYSDVIMSAMRPRSPASRLFTQPLFRRRSKKTAQLRVTKGR